MARKDMVIARFSEQYNMSIMEVLKMLRLAKKAEEAQVRHHNEPDPTGRIGHEAELAMANFKAFVVKFGLGTNWSPGLSPVLMKGKEMVHLPD